ncbi:MAG: VOC family protein [Chloroflexi bacterium]|nr:MAG: VOC family protein [Chloroflexota bacterium]
MEARISLITLGVQDLDTSITFYRDGLGLPLREGTDGIAFFELKGTWLALFPLQALAADAGVSSQRGAFAGFTLAHNVRSKQGVDQVLQQAQDAGAVLIKPAASTDWGGYSGYFQDPDGYLWEVAWNPHFWIE